MKTKSHILLTFLFSLFTLSSFVSVPHIAEAQESSAEVESKVRSSFVNIPVMIAIAKCESSFRQFDSSNNVLHGGTGSMVGIFQIDENIHKTKAASFGFDIDTVQGNIGYAEYMYETQGVSPWLSSFPCWNKIEVGSGGSSDVVTTNPLPSGSAILTSDLSLGMIDPQVLTLQQLLNRTGFRIVEEGPGSIGNETTKFGSLTRLAVRRFQCAQKIVCGGDEFSTSYGFVGKRTRAALLDAVGYNNDTGISTPTESPKEKPALVKELENQISALLEQIAALQAQLASLAAKSTN